MSDASDGNQRLTLAQVEDYVAALSDRVVEMLALGPMRDLTPKDPEYWLEDQKDCRVCQALDPIESDSPAAAALLDWHSFVSKSFDMLNKIILAKDITDDDERKLQDEALALFGTLAYSRCLVIYSAARAEKLKRTAQTTTTVGGS